MKSKLVLFISITVGASVFSTAGEARCVCSMSTINRCTEVDFLGGCARNEDVPEWFLVDVKSDLNLSEALDSRAQCLREMRAAPECRR